MKNLQTTDGVLLSKILKEVSPIIYESNRQVNKLLDGSYHVQIIGEPLKRKEAVILSTYSQVEQLNRLIDKGSPLILKNLDERYLVYIEKPISWKRLNFGHGDKNKSYFEGVIIMLLENEVLP